jgi:hypothetical protein
MKKERLAKSVREFDRRFDAGEDVSLIDMEKAVIRHRRKSD